MDEPRKSEALSSSYCCFHATLLPAIGAKFIGHWEIRIGVPLFVVLLSVTSYAIGVFVCYNRCVLLLFFTASFALFFYSYIKTIVVGPGYLPWFQSVSDEAKDDNSYGGVITNQYQMDYAKANYIPPRCIVSSTARRIVIRADHFCDFIASFVGIRNHKLFILFNVYGVIYLGMFLYICCWALMNLINDPSMFIIVLILYLVFGLSFFMMTISFAVEHIWGLRNGLTGVDELKRVPKNQYNRGFKKNAEEIFGRNQTLFQCLMPFSPYENKKNSEIVRELEDKYGTLSML